MKKITIKELTKSRFDALVAYCRSPITEFFSVELSWYADEEEKVIGLVLLDTTDLDYTAIVLARDERGRYRAIDLQVSVVDQETATEWLKRAIRWHSSSVEKIFPQGEKGSAGVDLFTTIAPVEKLHPGFVMLKDSEGYSSAKGIISEMMPHFVDIDGNFVEQFQTTGFDARLWELYLFAYITEEALFLERTHHRPDFVVTKYSKTVGIEAVTVGRKAANPPKLIHLSYNVKLPEEFDIDQYMPIRYGSALYTKLKKKYWELPSIKDKPLIFAIADFHDDRSMLWSSTSLIQYLYGVKHAFHYDKDGKLIISPRRIEKHQIGEKEIPSGFFFQPDSEHVSAVLFSASGTLSKFNRMGKLAGFGSPHVRLVRMGTCYNHDPNAALPHIFCVEIDPKKYSETWAEGLSMFHNPNALHPVPEELFPSIAHHHYVEGQIVSRIPEFYPYGSLTFIVTQNKH